MVDPETERKQVSRYEQKCDKDPLFEYRKRGFARIHLACQEGRIEAVRRDLKAGVSVDIKNRRNKHKPIVIAASARRFDIVELLLDHGADIEESFGNYGTPLGFLEMYTARIPSSLKRKLRKLAHDI